jgi:DNA mismatch repair ATPase MutL
VPAADEAVAQDAAVEEPTAVPDAPAEEAPAESTASEVPAADEAVAQDAAVEEPTAVPDAPAEEPVTEEATSEEPATEPGAAVEEKAAEEQAAEGTSSEATSANEPVAEEPVAETASEEPVTKKVPAEETAPETPADEEPTSEATSPSEPAAEEPVTQKTPAAEVAQDEGVEEPAPAAAEAEASQVTESTPERGAEAAEEPQAEPNPAVPATLRTAYDAAAATLAAHDLTGTSARTYLVLDRSASMRPYYKDGSAQALGEQTLALAAHLDPESKVHVVFFSTELDGTGELTLTDHENKIDDLHAGLGRMGRTSYHAAVEEVLAHHTKESPDTPALVVFQTDGAPDAKTPATQALTEAAKTHPAVFFSFVAFGDPENKAFDYLRKLKLTNTSHFLAGETPKELTDAEVYEGILANWRP